MLDVSQICLGRALRAVSLGLWAHPRDSLSTSLFYGVRCSRPILYFSLPVLCQCQPMEAVLLLGMTWTLLARDRTPRVAT